MKCECVHKSQGMRTGSRCGVDDAPNAMCPRSHRIRTAFESALVVSARLASAAQRASPVSVARQARLRASSPGTIAPSLPVERRQQQLDPIGVLVQCFRGSNHIGTLSEPHPEEHRASGAAPDDALHRLEKDGPGRWPCKSPSFETPGVATRCRAPQDEVRGVEAIGCMQSVQ